MESSLLIGKLPPYQNNAVLVQRNQTVYDIINEVLEAHELFRRDYDNIAADFWTGDIETTARKIFDFLKRNVRYKIETEGKQTTKSPAAILAHGIGDCKHYASFINGVFDAINRKYNQNINWFYRFASYNFFDREPAHVFAVVKKNGREIWIDPVLDRIDKRVEPSYFLDKKVKSKMALTRISGLQEDVVNNTATAPANILLDITSFATDPTFYMSIQTLLKHSAMDLNAVVDQQKVISLQNILPPAEYATVVSSYNTYKQRTGPIDGGNQQIAGFFDDILRGIKVVTLAASRGAFLGIVAVNGFGYATKLKAAIWKPDGTYTTFKDKVKDVWQNKLGGQYSVLENTIRNGATHKAIIGGPEMIAAWAAAAAAIIAAIMPLVKTFLANNNEIPQGNYEIDPTTGLPYGINNPKPTPLQWLQNNPLIAVGAVVGGVLVYRYYKKNKRGANV
jgi:hypothetical protein